MLHGNNPRKFGALGEISLDQTSVLFHCGHSVLPNTTCNVSKIKMVDLKRNGRCLLLIRPDEV
jgi:hypothetical protein